jgi:nucleotide-binding universal stress UspA family protein
MLSSSKILVPLDFSQRSIGAAHYGMTLARRYGCQVVLLHVILPLQYEVGTLEFGGAAITDLIANREEFARRQLHAFLTEELEGMPVERVLLEGDPAQQIVQYAHEVQAGLIVMPTHGYGPFRRFILGSVTAKVLHDADCPVWTGVHLEDTGAVPDVPIQRVLCAIDLGPQSRRALEWARSFSRDFKATLMIVHAVPRIESRPTGAAADTTDWLVDLSEMARQELSNMQAEVGSDAEVRIEAGDPAHAVHKAAAELNADLVVIGRGSAAGVFGRLRANAYSIIREAPCPVVSV